MPSTTPAEQFCNAEFIDSKVARQCFGLGKSYLYLLHEKGLITGVSLRQSGTTRGKRLWSSHSIRAYLTKCEAIELQERANRSK